MELNVYDLYLTMERKVEISDVTRLRKLFKKKKWYEKTNEEFVFENFCILLDNLTKDQKELLHELSENYLWISASEYEATFNDIFISIYKHRLIKCKTLYLIPVVKVSERAKIKSSDHCVYLIKGILNLNQNYTKIKTHLLDEFENIKKIKFQDDGSELVCFIDDFIGTGDTFKNCWLDLTVNNSSITINNSVLASLIFQKEGFNYIKNNIKIPIFYHEVRPKGISDHFTTPEKEEKIKIMKEIEKLVKPGSFSFGYKASEALVTMIRTPNNTFPIFWKKYKIKKEQFIPPFIRN
jgi:hypothetical protein